MKWNLARGTFLGSRRVWLEGELRCVPRLLALREVSPTVPAVEPVTGWPPYLAAKDFLASHLWPSSRATLFIALKERKFHSFLLVDGKTRAKSRIIDVRSALQYLAKLSEAAKGQGTSPLDEPISGKITRPVQANPAEPKKQIKRPVTKSAKH